MKNEVSLVASRRMKFSVFDYEKITHFEFQESEKGNVSLNAVRICGELRWVFIIADHDSDHAHNKRINYADTECRIRSDMLRTTERVVFHERSPFSDAGSSHIKSKYAVIVLIRFLRR